MLLAKRIRNLFISRRKLKDIALKQVKAGYAGTYLGVWWAVIVPAALAFASGFVFSVIFDTGIKRYAFFVLPAMISWLFFVNTLNGASGSFAASAGLLRQSGFLREFIPLAEALSHLFNLFIGLIVFLPLFALLNHKTILLWPVLLGVVLLELIFVSGAALFSATISVFLGDTPHFLSIFTALLFWLTPVFYGVESVPEPARRILFFNPLSYFVSMYRDILFYARMPEWQVMLSAGFFSLAVFLFGYGFFLKNEPQLLKRL